MQVDALAALFRQRDDRQRRADITEAVSHLRADLIESGMTSYDVATIQQAYESALRIVSENAWRHFYEDVITGLLRMSGKPRRYGERARRATESLLRLIDDDFGASLVDPALAAQLRLR